MINNHVCGRDGSRWVQMSTLDVSVDKLKVGGTDSGLVSSVLSVRVKTNQTLCSRRLTVFLPSEFVGSSSRLQVNGVAH